MRALRQATDRFNQWFCGLSGHSAMLRYETDRLSLQCQDCGWQSEGWEIGPEKSDARKYLDMMAWRRSAGTARRTA